MQRTLRKHRRAQRFESEATLFGIPLVSVATGPNFWTGEKRGHARGIIAIGDVATGLLAIGGIARGGVAIGGLAVGGIALGGLAVGGLVLAGVALGVISKGGVAIGHYAKGGIARGTHVMSRKRHEPEVERVFEPNLSRSEYASEPFVKSHHESH
jgi:hypothetical protein